MDKVSFNDTIGKTENVVDLGPHSHRSIQTNSIDMYVAIDKYSRSTMVEKTKFNTRYKIVDNKVKPVAIRLLED